MIPYDLDPSLHAHEPECELLDDGFSPPHHADPAAVKKDGKDAAETPAEDMGLGPKSLF